MVIRKWSDKRLALVKLKTTNLQLRLNDIKKDIRSCSSAYPFEYSFLMKNLISCIKQKPDRNLFLSIFSVIAISIACLGLFGLASYTAVKRTKEIGVRKVLGSSVQNIVVLLSKDLLKPVLLGTLIAIPAWILCYAVNGCKDLPTAYTIQWWMFAAAALIAVIIALLTVSVQAVKAALANPVKSLRTE